MTLENKFKGPMLPWHALPQYGKETYLPNLNLRLFFYEAGLKNAQTIVMVHGLGDEADTWRHILIPVSENFHVIALDLPGFGRSDKSKQDYTPEFLMVTILRLMDNLNITSAILMGSSLGAILSHAIAIKHPERVNGLILVGGAILGNKLSSHWSLKMMQIPLFAEFLYNRLRKDPDKAYKTLDEVYQDINSLPEIDQAFLYQRVNQRVWDDGQRDAYLSTLRSLTSWLSKAQKNLVNRLGKLKKPTLIIRGQYDELFKKLTAECLLKIQPNADFLTIEGVKHLPQQENPEVFLESINLWLKTYF